MHADRSPGASEPPSSQPRARSRSASILVFGLAATMAAGVMGGAHAMRLEQDRVIEEAVVPDEAPPIEPTAPPAFQEPFFPFLDDEPADGSVSVGGTSHGWIVNARKIEESDALGILPRQKERGLAHGSDQIVAVIEEAARDLHDATQTRLWIGNVGQPGGGDIGWSVSHNSGRDADIAFCYRDAAGNPVDPPDLVPLNPDGSGKEGGIRFDPDRTWRVVRSILESDAADVQYLFISHSLKVQLLAAANRQGAPAELVSRASVVLRQPGGSHPHDDHLHLRVFCSERDLAGGCIDEGAVHPFSERPTGVREKRIAELAGRLVDPNPEQRRRAILRLGLLDATAQVEAIARHLVDDAATVRAASSDVLGALGTDRHVPALIEAFDRETDTTVFASLARSIGRLGGPLAGPFLLARIADPSGGGGTLLGAVDVASRVGRSPVLFPTVAEAGSPLPPLFTWAVENPGAASDPTDKLGLIRLAAIRAAAEVDSLEPAGALWPLLASPEPTIRGEVARSLSFITNRTFAVEEGKGLEEVQKTFTIMKGRTRGAWLVAGFVTAGYRVTTLDNRSVWELVRAIGGEEHLAYNATRTLVRIAGEGEESLGWPRAATCRHWLRYFDTRRADFSLPRPPGNTQRACWGLRDDS